MAKSFRPMLADKVTDIDKLVYPILCSIKLDGIRCEVIDGEAKSRTLKNIPNSYISNELQQIFKFHKSQIFDGELLAGKSFQECSSSVMKEEGEPDFRYYVFDIITDNNIEETYENRMKKLEALQISDPRIVKVLPVKINNKEELLAFEEECLGKGLEGVMIRSLDGPYKFGRSTFNEGYLLKLKRFVDSEITITSLEELMTNTNKKETNELGLTKRASNKENMKAAGTLGTIVGIDCVTGKVVRLGTGKGLTKKLRQEIWDNKDSYIGKLAKYKHFEQSGVKINRRIPVFLGFRSEDDMGE